MEKEILTKVFLIIIVLLLSGFIIGFLTGGKTMQDQWSSFYEKENEKTERYCICNYPETLEEQIVEFPLDIIKEEE